MIQDSKAKSRADRNLKPNPGPTNFNRIKVGPCTVKINQKGPDSFNWGHSLNLNSGFPGFGPILHFKSPPFYYPPNP